MVSCLILASIHVFVPMFCPECLLWMSVLLSCCVCHRLHLFLFRSLSLPSTSLPLPLSVSLALPLCVFVFHPLSLESVMCFHVCLCTVLMSSLPVVVWVSVCGSLPVLFCESLFSCALYSVLLLRPHYA